MAHLLAVQVDYSTRYVRLYQDEDAVWIAECVDLPGCVSDGDTPMEAIENVMEAIRAVEGVLCEELASGQTPDLFCGTDLHVASTAGGLHVSRIIAPESIPSDAVTVTADVGPLELAIAR